MRDEAAITERAEKAMDEVDRLYPLRKKLPKEWAAALAERDAAAVELFGLEASDV